MPNLFPAVPSYPVLRIRARRALVLATTGLAIGAASASAEPGGAEAGDPAAAEPRAVEPAASEPLAAPTRAAIRTVQRKLRLAADGVYGPRTRAAVRRFQRRHELAADGRLTPATLEALGVRGRAARAAGPLPTGAAARQLAAIAECESGSDPEAISRDGQYRGKYQFLPSTWESIGGTGDPAKASEDEQDRRAAALLSAQGTAPWPVCGRKAA